MKNKYPYILLTLFFISFLVFLTNTWLHPPKPKYEGEIKVESLNKVVKVYTDSYGVPHIFAENEQDLFFTAGYLSARERLFQLSTVALAVKGELGSVFGNDLLKTDIYLRTWRIHSMGRKMVANMDPKNRQIFKNFCDGINYHIDEAIKDLPIEFKILGFKPSYWDPSIVAGYARMMAHEMQGSWKAEVIFGAINNYFGKDKLLEIIPDLKLDHPTIAGAPIEGMEQTLSTILNIENNLRSILGDPSADIGSNSWVVSGAKTKTGLPFLANDPHLAFSQPSRWYEIHLNGGRFNVSGLCLAGIPLPVIGQNERTAWGFTNTMVDDVDFFVEKINPTNKNEYRHGDSWREILTEKEHIPLKGGGDTTIFIRSTHHGPIISDIHPLLKDENKAISLAWTGHWITSEMDAWVNLNNMSNWEEFTEGVKSFGVPGQNIIYADIDGNIGWRPAVYIPIRREGFSMIPKQGDNPLFDWKGMVPFEEMPFLYNPEKGFISTANNRTIDEDFPYYISGLWADPSRIRVINKKLEERDTFDLEYMKEIQLEYTSEFASIVLPSLLEQDIKEDSQIVKRAMTFLRSWDCVESKDSEATLIFHSIIKALVKNIYYDELTLLGDNYYDGFAELKYFVHRKLRELIVHKNSSWIDNIETKNKIETLDEILTKSIYDGIFFVENNYGPNWSNWKWGDAHSITHKHMLSKSSLIDKVFGLSIGPFKSGGSDKTPNAGGYRVTKSFKQTAGASVRRIVDFSDMDNTQIILPTGQSGLPNSPNYYDQASLYNSGDYRKTLFNEESIKEDLNMRILLLTP